jgi:hypothetical protein
MKRICLNSIPIPIARIKYGNSGRAAISSLPQRLSFLPTTMKPKNHLIPSAMASRMKNRYFSTTNSDDQQHNTGVPTAFADVPGVKTPGDKLILMFTCRVCETRSAKKISKHSYEKGVVVCRCAGCNNLHLICDHIGIFEDPGWDINKFLQESEGKGMKYVNDQNIIELNAEDILGYGRALPNSSNQ